MSLVHDNVKRIIFRNLGENPDCGVCFEPLEFSNATFMTCSHVLCGNCAPRLKKKECPFCREKIEKMASKNMITQNKKLKERVEILERDNFDLEREATSILRNHVELNFRMKTQEQIIRALRNEIEMFRNGDNVNDGTVRRRLIFDSEPSTPPTEINDGGLFGMDTPQNEPIVIDSSSETGTPPNELATPRVRNPCRCTACGELGHNRRNRRCPRFPTGQ